MRGRDVKSLELILMLDGVETQLWMDKYNHGDTWFPMVIPLKSDAFSKSSSNYFRLKFVATRGRSYFSDMALDDIRFYPCGPVTTSTS